MAKFKISEKELQKEINLAKKAGKKAYRTEPRAISVKYNKRTGRVIVDLNTGISFMFPAILAEELNNVSKAKLSNVKILADGFAIYWEDLDVALSVPDLLQGVFGSESWMKNLDYSSFSERLAVNN